MWKNISWLCIFRTLDADEQQRRLVFDNLQASGNKERETKQLSVAASLQPNKDWSEKVFWMKKTLHYTKLMETES